MLNEDTKDRIIDFKVDVKVDSDHLPLYLRKKKRIQPQMRNK